MKYGTGVNLILTKVLSIFVTEVRACSDISLIFADLISRITQEAAQNIYVNLTTTERAEEFGRPLEIQTNLRILLRNRGFPSLQAFPFTVFITGMIISHDSCLEARVQRNLSILMSFSSSTSYVD